MPHRFQTLKKLMEANHLLSSDGEMGTRTFIPLPEIQVCCAGTRGCLNGCEITCKPGCSTCQSGSRLWGQISKLDN